MSTTPPFSAQEYDGRLARTQARMADQGHSHLLVTDPANIYYLTGYDACSFYVPQALLVPATGRLALFAREIDASSASATTVLDADQVFGYPERYVQQVDVHPMEWIARTVRPWLDSGSMLAVEAESPYYTVRSHRVLSAALSSALGDGIEVAEAPAVVNWVRALKSPAEIEVMRAAGRMAEQVFAVAREAIRPGVRQCDAVAEIYAAQIRGLSDAGGSYPAIPPLVLAGVNTAFPHVAWSDEPFGNSEPIALELAGIRHRYHVPLARTMFLGRPPTRLLELAEVVGEGLEAAIGAIHPGVVGADVAAAWAEVIARHGLAKSGRVGYPVGIGYPPDWGEQTLSLRPGDRNQLSAGMTFHVMIGMWLDGWGYSVSETVLVTESGAECLAAVERGLWSVP